MVVAGGGVTEARALHSVEIEKLMQGQCMLMSAYEHAYGVYNLIQAQCMCLRPAYEHAYGVYKLIQAQCMCLRSFCEYSYLVRTLCVCMYCNKDSDFA